MRPLLGKFAIGVLLALALVPAAGVRAAVPLLILNGSPDTESYTGVRYFFWPRAIAKSDEPFRFEIENKPTWAVFDPAWGRISGVPRETDVGVYPGIRISLVSGATKVELPAFSINVQARPADAQRPQARRFFFLQWTPPETNEDGTPAVDLAGYNIYLGQHPSALRRFHTVLDPTTLKIALSDLPVGANYFAVSCFNAEGIESALSAIVSTTAN